MLRVYRLSKLPIQSCFRSLCSHGGDKPPENDKNNKNLSMNKSKKLPEINKNTTISEKKSENVLPTEITPKGVKLPGAYDYKNPWDVLKYDLTRDPHDMVPRQSDILIIGGGIIGWSTAYWLAHSADVTVTVVERDPSYTRGSTVLSCGGIRQQFSEPENIQMSLFGAEFIRNIREHLSVLDCDPPDINYTPHGYLVLASDNGAAQLVKNYEVQREYGAKVELLSKDAIKKRWPWMNVDDIELGSYGFENEGWFDPYLLLCAFRRKAGSMGVNFVHGELIGFEGQHNVTALPRTALIRTTDGNINPIVYGYMVNAAGPFAGEVTKMLADMLDEEETLVLPVEPRRQHYYVISSKDRYNPGFSPGIDSPVLLDASTGIHMQRQDFGGDFIVHKDPPPKPKLSNSQEPLVEDLEVDYDWFDNEIWPKLAHRVPAMESLKVRSAWAGYYDYNYIDQNLIIGQHPVYSPLIFCNGSSGHGIQHAIAIGRAVSELIFHHRLDRSIDLRRFRYERFFEDQAVFEKNIF